MAFKTIEMMGPQPGYGIARRFEQTSENPLTLNYGTLHAALLKLEQEDAIASEWGVPENTCKAKFYKLTRTGRRAFLSRFGGNLGGEQRRGAFACEIDCHL